MNRLLSILDIDPRHFRALLKLAWRMDMRATKLGFGMRKKGKNPLLIFIMTSFFYMLIGLIFAEFSYRTADVFLSGTVVVGGIIFMLGGMMLVEYNTIVISPDDYHILGYMPISSRTYFLAKTVNLLLYMFAFAAVLGGPTILVHAFRDGFHALRFLSAAAAVFGAGLFVALGTSVLYGVLLHVFNPERLANVLAYVQFAVSFFVYAGYIFLPRLLDQYSLTGHIDKAGYLLLLPTTWFVAFLELGYGLTESLVQYAAVIALFSLIFLLRASFTRISLDYAQRIAALSIEQAAPQNERLERKPKWELANLFRHPEGRVVVRLAAAQFRHDNKFRLSVLGIIPLLVVYFFLGLQEGNLTDPFVEGTKGLNTFFLFFFALLMIPLLMKQSFEMSDAYEASWIFFATPANVPRLILAARNVMFVVFTLPPVLFIFILFNHFFATTEHALIHAAAIAVISFIFLQITYLVNPRLPFSEPKTRGGRSRLFSALFLILPAIGLGLLHLLIRFVYTDPLRMLLTALFFFGLILFIERLIHLRVQRTLRRLQFGG